MRYKKWLINVLKYFALLALAISAVGYLLDPMQIFHKSYFSKNLYLHTDMRKQAAGIINNFEFDSFILGTSMLENTSAIEASKKLGGNFVNVSLSGSNFTERYLPLSYALSKKKIKTIIYSLDSVYIGQSTSSNDDFSFLYDNNPINDFKLYFSSKLIRYSFEYLTNKKVSTLEFPNEWFTISGHNRRFGGLENWFKAKNNDQIKDAFSSIVETANKIKNGEKKSLENIEQNIKNAKAYIDQYVLTSVEKYPDTKFILVFPPYSRMRYAQWAQYDLPSYETHKAVIRHLADQSDIYKNLEIYGYEDQEFLDDIANYKDLGHYHQWVNSMMIDSFASKTHLITTKNIDKYINTAEEKALNYNIFEISDRIEKYLKTTD